jgi:hypothetical protein
MARWHARLVGIEVRPMLGKTMPGLDVDHREPVPKVRTARRAAAVRNALATLGGTCHLSPCLWGSAAKGDDGRMV